MSLNADTAEQQAAAKYDWELIKAQVASTLGITLSDNANKAWDQITGLKNQTSAYNSGQNISGSGIENESIDRYLKNVRSSDSANRSDAKYKNDSN